LVDNTPNGNFDIVQLQADGQGLHTVARYSYRASLCSESECHWLDNRGNSLALDFRHETTWPVDSLGSQDMLYLADNNGATGKIRAFRLAQTVVGEEPSIPVSGEALCFVTLGEVEVAQERDVLYAPTGCQSFEAGSMVPVDTVLGQAQEAITYSYGDHHIVEVDPHDPRRVFVTTNDDIGDYDPQNRMILHMLYDDVVVASLPLLAGYPGGFDGLRDMVFDPAGNRLYLSVDRSILVVEVGGIPPATMWPAPVTVTITPEHGGTLTAGDASATFSFSGGAVTQTSRVGYAEAGPDTGQRLPVAGTLLQPVRTFDLTAVISDTGTAVGAFQQSFILNAETTARERAGTIPGTLALYWWNGSAWLLQPSSALSDDLLSASSTHTGRFALMAETMPVFVPALQR
jgi:hypothetical protein